MSDGTDGDCVDGFPGQRRFRVAGCSQPGEACVLEESPGISVVMALGALRATTQKGFGTSCAWLGRGETVPTCRGGHSAASLPVRNSGSVLGKLFRSRGTGAGTPRKGTCRKCVETV